MIIVRHAESEWNRYFGRLAIDPGIADPPLTPKGRLQAAEAAERLAGMKIARIIASPYRRTIETARIIGDILGLDITIEPLVRERCAFSCDQGTPPAELAADWPGIDFSMLEEVWWGGRIESQDAIEARGRAFLAASAGLPDRDRVAVVSHWGFIRAITGQSVGNAHILRLPAP